MEVSIFILLIGIIFGFSIAFLFRIPVGKSAISNPVKHTIVDASYKGGVLTLFFNNSSKIELSGDYSIWYKLPEFTRLSYKGENLCYNIIRQLEYISKSGSKFSPIDIDFDL